MIVGLIVGTVEVGLILNIRCYLSTFETGFLKHIFAAEVHIVINFTLKSKFTLKSLLQRYVNLLMLPFKASLKKSFSKKKIKERRSIVKPYEIVPISINSNF